MEVIEIPAGEMIERAAGSMHIVVAHLFDKKRCGQISG
jgi:hypothetical protein